MTTPYPDTGSDDDGPLLVSFGPNPTQVCPVEWAEKILSNYRERYPSAFAKIMGECSLEGYQKEAKNKGSN